MQFGLGLELIYRIGELFDVDTTGVANDYILQYNTGTSLWEAVPYVLDQEVIGFTVDCNTLIGLSSKAFREIPFDGTILGWKLVTNTDTANAIKISIQKTTDYISYDEVISTELDKPQLTAAKSAEDFTLSNWTTNITKNEILRFTVDSVTDVQQLHFFLTIRRSA